MSYSSNPRHPCIPLPPGFSGSLADKAKADGGGLVPNWVEDNFFDDAGGGDAAGDSTSYWPVVAAVSVLALGGAWLMRKGSR